MYRKAAFTSVLIAAVLVLGACAQRPANTGSGATPAPQSQPAERPPSPEPYR